MQVGSRVQSSMAISESISNVNLSFSTVTVRNIFDRLLALAGPAGPCQESPRDHRATQAEAGWLSSADRRPGGRGVPSWQGCAAT